MAEHIVSIEKTLNKLLEEKKYQTLKDVMVTMNGADIAAVSEPDEPGRLRQSSDCPVCQCV